jgi:hypothetical protein
MANDYRECPGTSRFNTGNSKCILDPDKIKAIILTIHGYKLPKDLTPESIEAACHADRPERIYPIKTIVEYAPSGGEAQTSANGYGPNKVTGYSAKNDVWTLQDYDATLKANIMAAKGIAFDAYFVDANNILYGENDGTDTLAGIPLSGIYPGGQDWDSSGTEANLTIATMFKDYEKYVKNADVRVCKFDIVEALKGLVYVEFMSTGDNKYRLIEHFGRLNITSYYKDMLTGENASKVLNGVTSVTYEDGDLVVTAASGGGAISLKSPSVLQTNGITGIEQWS